MSFQNEFEGCLASLSDSAASIHSNQTSLLSRSPSPSTAKGIVLRSRSDSHRRPYTRSPLGELSTSDNIPRARSSSRASSFTGSLVISHESRYSVRHSISNSFQALPPILSGSNLQFHSNFQSFMISSGNIPRSRRLSERAPALPPLPSLSQPLFPSIAESGLPGNLLQIPSISHRNSPYVPYDSPVRRLFRPLTPESSESISECSRSGACAPEPTEFCEPMYDHKMVRISRSIRKMHRTVKHVAHVAKRIFSRQKHVDVEASSGPPRLVIDTHALPNTSLHPPISPGVASFDSSNTRSLALWLETRRQDEWDADSRHMMSLEDYERRGSWINLVGGKAFVCSIPGCSIHSRLSNFVASFDASVFDPDTPCSLVHRASDDSQETAVPEHSLGGKTDSTDGTMPCDEVVISVIPSQI